MARLRRYRRDDRGPPDRKAVAATIAPDAPPRKSVPPGSGDGKLIGGAFRPTGEAAGSRPFDRRLFLLRRVHGESAARPAGRWQAPSGQPPAVDEQHFRRERAVEETAGDRMDGYP